MFLKGVGLVENRNTKCIFGGLGGAYGVGGWGGFLAHTHILPATLETFSPALTHILLFTRETSSLAHTYILPASLYTSFSCTYPHT